MALAWGVIRVLVVLLGSRLWVDGGPVAIAGDEAVWGFGQVMAVGLLLLPILSFFGERISLLDHRLS